MQQVIWVQNARLLISNFGRNWNLIFPKWQISNTSVNFLRVFYKLRSITNSQQKWLLDMYVLISNRASSFFLSFHHDFSLFQQYVVESLTALFRQSYPDVSLALFGSCANGFETKTSDMDICVVFPDNSPNTLVWYNGTFNEKQGVRFQPWKPWYIPLVVKGLQENLVQKRQLFANLQHTTCFPSQGSNY